MPRRSRQDHRPERIRVLHVDDDPEFAELTAQLLEHEDDRLAVTTATSAGGGLDLLAAARFDCVVSDYEMPGRNGLEFLDAVRAEDPDLPFILYTGKGSEELASEAISAGVTDYLQKSGGTDQYAVLANRVRNAVEHGGSDVAVTIGQLADGFYVEDDGLGVPADDRERIFDAGYSTERDGTGFGLSIVEGVADAHDWSVRVAEGVDGGARFEITGLAPAATE